MKNIKLKYSGVSRILSSSLLKNTAIYTVSTVLNSAIPFFLIPILTRFLSPEDYGLISIYSVLVAFVSPFIGYNIHANIIRMYFSHKHSEWSEYIGNCFYLLAASIVIVVLVFLFIDKWTSQSTLIPIKWVWSSIILAVTQFISLVILSIWQAKGRALYFGVFQFLSTLFNFGATLFLVMYMHRNWEGRIEAQIIVGILFSIVTFYLLFRGNYIRFTFKKEYFVEAAKFGIPLIPHVIGGIFLSIVNRFFLLKYAGLKETGLFFLAFQITSIVNILTSALNTAYVPWLFGKLASNNEAERKKIVVYTYRYFIFLIASALIFAFTVPFALKIFVGQKFFGAEKYFLFLILSAVFNGMYLMVTNYIVFVKKTYILAWLTFVSSLVSIALNYYLIIHMGAIGAAMASAAGFGILFVATWVLSAYVYPMPWFTAKSKTYLDAHG